MRIIKQFKEGSTPEDIFKQMQKGDVVNINSVVYIKGDRGIIFSEYGTTWDVSMLAELCVTSAIRWRVCRGGARLIDAITVAERGYI